MNARDLISRINARILPYAQTAIKQGYQFRNDPDRPDWLVWEGTHKKGKVKGKFPEPTQEIADLFNTSEFQYSRIAGYDVTLAERGMMLHLFEIFTARLDDAGFEDNPFNVAMKQTIPYIKMWLEDKPENIKGSAQGAYIRISLPTGYELEIEG
jgi:hypothetical protein